MLTCVPSGGGGGEADLTVNELMTGITGAASNEFVEIANTGTAAADLSGWKLVYRSAAGTSDVVLATVADGTVLPAGGFFLFGGSAYVGGPAGRPELLGEHRSDRRRRGPPRRRRHSRRLGRLGDGNKRVRGRNGDGRTSDNGGAGNEHRTNARR